MNNLKMYIAVLDTVPTQMVPVICAHASIMMHMSHTSLTTEYTQWLKNSFRKCVIKVNTKESKRIMELGNVVEVREKTQGTESICWVPQIYIEVPNVLKYAKLWAPSKQEL